VLLMGKSCKQSAEFLLEPPLWAIV
jgi:hypothetical protein